MYKYLLLITISFAGCTPIFGYDYAIEMVNNNNSTMYSVLVESTKGLEFPFGTCVPNAGKYWAGSKQYPFRDNFTISWSNLESDMFNDFGNKPFTKTIDTASIPENFKGVLQLRITNNNDIVFTAIPYSEYYAE